MSNVPSPLALAAAQRRRPPRPIRQPNGFPKGPSVGAPDGKGRLGVAQGWADLGQSMNAYWNGN